MDKGKGGAIKRGPNKVKASLFPPGDFIALGTKAARPDISDTKAPATLPAAAAAKKAKLTSRPSGKGEQWDSLALEVEAGEVVSKVLDAEDKGEDAKVEAYLCGAVKLLKQTKNKPDQTLYLSLLYLAKTRPNYFSTKSVTEAFCNLLKRDGTTNFKTKGNSLAPVLAANILMTAHSDETKWPESFLKVYLEDSLGDRVWVDQEDCRGFVDNIQTAFNTTRAKPLVAAVSIPENQSLMAGPSPPSFSMEEDETSSSSIPFDTKENVDNIAIQQRYLHNWEAVEAMVVEAIQDQLSRRQAMEVSRNTLRLLAATAGLSEVRLLVSQRLELWLHNPKLTKPAQDLLLVLCLNCNKHNQHDVEVISNLIKIRIKKPLLNHFLHCLKELLGRHPDNLSTVLKNAIYNELSNARGLYNLQVVALIFQHAPDQAPRVLAEVFRDLLLRKDDYLRVLRALLREIVRTLRHDLNFGAFCLGLLQERKDPVANTTFRELEQSLKERYFYAIADLVVLTIFLAISPSVREVAAAYSRGDKKDIGVLRTYQAMVAGMQRDAVWWLHTLVHKMMPKMSTGDFVHCLHKVLFMESAEHYFNKDGWPPENERGLMLRLASEVPVLEDTLVRILVMGYSRDHPISAPDALDLTDQLIRRAAAIFLDDDTGRINKLIIEDTPVLVVEKVDLIDALFNLCTYHHPDHITLPQGYQPPKLAILDLYWKAWVILLIVVANNPSSFGQTVWDTYPTLKCLMEMCITNNFNYPPPTMATGERADDMRNQEVQDLQQEREQILEFESHLAGSAITETNSHLVTKLMGLDPRGRARRPPTVLLETLSPLSKSLRLGQRLCSSDFLLDVIQRQGTSQAMPWLADLVESSPSFSMLPVQCLCEFLLTQDPAPKKKRKQEELLRHLQDVVFHPGEDCRPTYEILDYFMRRLSSHQPSARTLAAKGLGMVLSNNSPEVVTTEEPPTMDEYQQLLHRLPELPHFESVKTSASISLRQACHVESNPNAVLHYVLFLAMFTPEDNHQEFADLALDMAQMVVERSTIVNVIVPPDQPLQPRASYFLSALLNIFLRYLHAAKKPATKEAYAWADTQDHILVQWSNEEAATLHIVVVHAMVILLTFGPPLNDRALFDELLNTWFPPSGDVPQAYLVDTSEEALLLPDWLKLRMIRSSVDVLVDAALKDLDASQLVLFIQSFGIPVTSMSKLLQGLDEAVGYDAAAVEQSVVDKAYMAQLVEVQHHRGATGGTRFARLLLHHREGSDAAEGGDEDYTAVQTSVIQQGPPRPPVPIMRNDMLPAVMNLFCVPSLIPRRQQEIYLGLHKALLQDNVSKSPKPGAVVDFVAACVKVMQSERSVEFVHGLHHKYSYSVVLFRLCVTNTVLLLQMYKDESRQVEAAVQKLVGQLLWLFNKVLQLSEGLPPSPLASLCQDFIARHSGSKLAAVIPAWRQDLLQLSTPITADLFLEVVGKVKQEEPEKLEEAVSRLVELAVRQGETKNLVMAMTRLLVESSHTSNWELSLYIDWLSKLEPELIQSVQPLQLQMVFGSSQHALRPFLLSWLVHQAGWPTLHSCLRPVLWSSTAGYNPEAVLNFLDMLPAPLTASQARTVVDYVLMEGRLSSRMDLLLRCQSPQLTAQYLCHLVASGSSSKEEARLLLLHLYMQVPNLLLQDIPPEYIAPHPVLFSAQSKLDMVSHAVILALANNHPGDRMAEVVCRKLAAVHPLLFLRQLGMLSSLLRGRIEARDFSIFRSRGQLALFLAVLSVVELLGPALFASPASSEILACYLDMCSTYLSPGAKSELYPIIQRWLTLVHDFLEHAPEAAQEFLKTNRNTIQELSSALQDIPRLRCLLSEPPSLPPAEPLSSWPQLASLSRRLADGEGLGELESLSSRRPAILDNFTNDLKQLACSDNSNNRLLAFKLLLRLLRNNPRLSKDMVGALVHCLDTSNEDLLNTTLDHLPELALLCQEHASTLLKKTFNLGIQKNISTSSSVCETFSLLNIQLGCS